MIEPLHPPLLPPLRPASSLLFSACPSEAAGVEMRRHELFFKEVHCQMKWRICARPAWASVPSAADVDLPCRHHGKITRK